MACKEHAILSGIATNKIKNRILKDLLLHRCTIVDVSFEDDKGWRIVYVRQQGRVQRRGQPDTEA
jgi:hypothetical protein